MVYGRNCPDCAAWAMTQREKTQPLLFGGKGRHCKLITKRLGGGPIKGGGRYTAEALMPDSSMA